MHGPFTCVGRCVIPANRPFCWHCSDPAPMHFCTQTAFPMTCVAGALVGFTCAGRQWQSVPCFGAFLVCFASRGMKLAGEQDSTMLRAACHMCVHVERFFALPSACDSRGHAVPCIIIPARVAVKRGRCGAHIAARMCTLPHCTLSTRACAAYATIVSGQKNSRCTDPVPASSEAYV